MSKGQFNISNLSWVWFLKTLLGLPVTLWRLLRGHKFAFGAYLLVLCLCLMALGADFLAYNKPLWAIYEGEVYFPLLMDYLAALEVYEWAPELRNVNWKGLTLDGSIWPLIPYLPNDQDILNGQLLPPFSGSHFLGTDDLGRDVLSGIIHGARISLSVGIFVMMIAGFIGIVIGSLSGYFGDEDLKVARIHVWISVFGVWPGWFYGFFLRFDHLGMSLGEGSLVFFVDVLVSFVIFLGVLFCLNVLVIPLKKIPLFNIKVNIWLDLLLSRFSEVVIGFPVLLVFISIASIAESSLVLLIWVLGLTAWTSIARYVRGEMLTIRELSYVEAAKGLGLTHFQVMWKHVLPNAMAPVSVALAFVVAAAILAESALSFLGIGVPQELMTWGKMLSLARGNTSAWWLAIFPGITIFVTVASFNLIGEGLKEAMNPKKMNKKR